MFTRALEQLRATYSAPVHDRLDVDHRQSLLYCALDLDLPLDTPASKRALRWIDNIHRVDSFIEMQARLPRENRRLDPARTSEEERHLAFWIRFQRRPATRELLCTYQLRRLEALRGFHWDPLETRWHAMFDDYESYMAATGQIPRYRTADQDERRLAAWADKQRKRHRARDLPEERTARLRAIGVVR
jgi:hypothetical protein